MNGDLAKLMELGESVDSVVRDIRLLGFLTDYAAEGGKIIVALDTAELVRYFLPMSEGEILASLNRFSAPRYKAQQVALAFIFERERLFSPGPPRPYLLLPPYEEELADHLSELKRRADFANLLAATSSAAFEHVLEDLLDVDTSGIASAIEKSKRDRLLTDEDEAKVLSLLREKYADFLYGMRFLGSDIGTEQAFDSGCYILRG